MCHSLAFDQIGGTIRTLRHGSPAQVIGDLRALYRAGGPQRPAELSAGARALPGDVAQIRAAVQYRPRPRQPRQPRRSGDPRGLLAGRRLLRLPRGGAAAAGHAQLRHPPGRLPDPLSCCTAGSTIATTRSCSGPASRGSRARRPAPAATARPPRNSARDLLLPDLASCRDCHGGEHTAPPVASTCAMCHDYHMDWRHARHAAPAARPRPALGDDGDPDRPAGGGEGDERDARRPDHRSPSRLRSGRSGRAQPPAARPHARRARRDERRGRTCCSPPATSPTMATTTSPTAPSGRRSPACPSRSIRRWAITTAARAFLAVFPDTPAPDGFIQYAIEDLAGAHPRPRHARGRAPRRRLLRDARRLADARGSPRRPSGRP